MADKKEKEPYSIASHYVFSLVVTNISSLGGWLFVANSLPERYNLLAFGGFVITWSLLLMLYMLGLGIHTSVNRYK